MTKPLRGFVQLHASPPPLILKIYVYIYGFVPRNRSDESAPGFQRAVVEYLPLMVAELVINPKKF